MSKKKHLKSLLSSWNKGHKRKKVDLIGEPISLTTKTTPLGLQFSAEESTLSWQRFLAESIPSGKSGGYRVLAGYGNPQQLKVILCEGSRFPMKFPYHKLSVVQCHVSLCVISIDESNKELYWQASLTIHPLDPWLSPCCEIERLRGLLVREHCCHNRRTPWGCLLQRPRMIASITIRQWKSAK